MRIFDNPENGLYHGEVKSVTSKAKKSSLNSSSTLFSCSLCAIYNRVHRDQKQHLTLKS